MALIFSFTTQPAAASNVVKALADELGGQVLGLQFPALDLSARVHLWVLRTFRQLAAAIEQAGPEQLRQATAIVDTASINNLDELDPLSTTGDPYATVVALLVLAFPEIHWMFVGASDDDDQPDFVEAHLLTRDATVDGVVRLRREDFIPLFDPAGLRERVRSRIRDAAENGAWVAPYVPAREAVAVAIDEEQDYAFLNAYVAYRFGYRCHALTSYEGAVRVLRSDVQRLFARAGEVFEREGRISTGDYLEALVTMHGESVKRLSPTSDVAALLQQPEFARVSALSPSSNRGEVEALLLRKADEYAHDRGRRRAGLRDVAAVLLEEYGFAVRDEDWGSGGSSEIALSLEDRYLNFPDKDPELTLHLSDPDVRNDVFGKLREVPHRVLVTTGHEQGVAASSLRRRLKEWWETWRHTETRRSTIYKPWSGIFDIWEQVNARGQAEWFVWPPATDMDDRPAGGGHSAHGRLLLVAEQLIARAQRILETARNLPDSIHGAVLALEAKEYLGHRTPTTSLEALALQHQFEVLAECRFYGVEHNMNVANRFADIERELASIGEWFRPAKRKRSRLNAELRIVSELLLIFREHSQFDEEQQALVKLRALHRGLWLRRHSRWAWVLWPLRAYIETLLRSLGWLVGGFMFWVAALSCLYVLSGHGGQGYRVDHYWHGFVDAMISFVGLSPPHDFETMWGSPGALRVCMLAFALGFLHLGIFITHLYAILTRR